MLTTAWNLLRFIKLNQRFLSYLHEIFSDIQVILVDDGSPDQCGKICDEEDLLIEWEVSI